MPVNVRATLRKAVRELQAEKARIDRQLTAIRGLLGSLDGGAGPAVRAARRVRKARRQRLSAAARRAVSQRMKAYWAKRRAASGTSKSRATAGK